MGYEAKIIADSIFRGKRLTTIQASYPRFIHAEAKTHRVINIGDNAYEMLDEVGFMDDKNLSRNAASSRAIPINKLIEQVLADPARPLRFMKNEKGMQSTVACNPEEEALATSLWLSARDAAVAVARQMSELGVHKQFGNRLLEPFQWMHVVVTASEWSNFFDLRCHKDAQPEFQHIACMMRDLLLTSEPTPIALGEWHLPYVLPEELNQYDHVTLCKISAARCARVSYLTHDKQEPVMEDDLLLYDRLVGGVPLHASPTEHQAMAGKINKVGPGRSNFNDHWLQFRKVVEQYIAANTGKDMDFADKEMLRYV